MTERSQHGLRRYRVRGGVAGLELVALQLAGVDVTDEVDVAAVPGVEHRHVIRRAPVRRHPDCADGTDREQRQRHRVVAGVDLEVGGGVRRDGGGGPGVPGGVFEGDDVRHVVGESDQRGAVDLATGALGDVVQHQRQSGRRGDRTEMRLDPGLRRPAVERADAQDSGDTEVPGLLGEADVVAGVRSGRAGDDRHGHGVHDRFEQRQFLVDRQRGGLARGAGHDEALVALFDQPSRQRHRGVDVEFACFVEGRDHRGEDPAETRHQRHHPGGESGRRPVVVRFTTRNLFDGRRFAQFDSPTQMTSGVHDRPRQ